MDTPTGSEHAYGHLKLRHLRLLALLDAEQSITAAARALHLSQPAASAMLKELESMLGMQLVERSHQGVRLNFAAQAALRRFRIALAEVDAARVEARQETIQRLRVGAMTVAQVEIVPRAIERFIAGSDRRRVELHEGTSEQLVTRMLRGDLDLVVGRRGAPWGEDEAGRQLRHIRLFNDPRCVVCREGHPLARRRFVDLAELAGQAWALPPPSSAVRVLFDDLFISQGITPPSPIVESTSVLPNIDLAAATDLLVLTPMTIARRYADDGRVRRIKCSIALSDISISAIWRRTSDQEPLSVAFREALRAAAADVARARDKPGPGSARGTPLAASRSTRTRSER